MKKHIAVDLGAESGRVVVGDLKQMDIVHRFTNRPVRLGDHLFWNILGIFDQIKIGLQYAYKKYPGQIISLGIDTWGVDFGLLDKDGDLIGNAYHYRDMRTDNMMDQVFKKIDKKIVFEETGIQFLQLNSLYQLYAFAQTKKDLLKQAKHFITIPNLFNYWLSGKMANEYSITTTTQLYNPRKKGWSEKIIKALDFDRSLFGQIVMPGTVLGELLPHLSRELGIKEDLKIIAPACHDTACAVVAVPTVTEEDYAYLSSGTWSLLGIESAQAIINKQSYEYNFTNEGSAGGGFRFLKNIMGLWLIQECKKDWQKENEKLSYTDIMQMAEDFGPSQLQINPNDPLFFKPGLIGDSMPDRIIACLKKTQAKLPQNKAEISRIIFQSLARLYAQTIKQIEQVTGRAIKALYIIGGGSQNTLLCRLTAQETGIPVHAGPVEATALGNILIQAVAMKQISSIEQGRRLIAESYDIKKYKP